MQRAGVPGLSAALVEDGQIVWSEGFGAGREQGGAPIRADTLAVASRADGRGVVCLTNSDAGLGACVEILDGVLGGDFSSPIRTVLERGW